MPRWEPDARMRFVSAALDLFTDQGYDETTVTQIADRAGLTRSTFFRHFSDKREVLAAGQETLTRLLAEGIAAAPPEATPLDAVEAGLRTVAAAMTEQNRELGPRIEAVIATSEELRERALLKRVGLTDGMRAALQERDVAEPVAAAAAELGALAFRDGFAEWTATPGSSLADLSVDALARLRAAVSQLG